MARYGCPPGFHAHRFRQPAKITEKMIDKESPGFVLWAHLENEFQVLAGDAT